MAAGITMLPGEQIILAQPANWIASLPDHNMSALTGEWLRRGVGGMKATEAVGGQLHLTTCRLVFRAHALNRLRGQVSVFLPTIRNVEDSSKRLMRQVTAYTDAGGVTFVVGKRERLMAAIVAARDKLTPEQTKQIVLDLEAHPEALGDQTKYSKLMHAVAIMSGTGGDIVGLITDPASLNTIANVLSLVGAGAEIAEDQLRHPPTDGPS